MPHYPKRCERDCLQVEPLLALDAAPDEWDRLARASGNLFATREWISTWWDAFGERYELIAFTCRGTDGTLVAILALCRSAEGVLRFVGHGESDLLGAICAPADQLAAASALKRALRSVRFEEFIADDVSPRFARAFGARMLRRTSSPVVRAPGWDDYLATRSAHFRQQVRRRERQLLREHGLRMRLAESVAELDTLLRLHAARWRERSRAFAGRRADFHRAFAGQALAKGWLRLWIAELDGIPAAAWYGFRYADSEWSYQGGRDPRADRLSVGSVLFAHTIRAALDEGMSEYRLLRGDESYKWRFATGDEPVATAALKREDLADG